MLNFTSEGNLLPGVGMSVRGAFHYVPTCTLLKHMSLLRASFIAPDMFVVVNANKRGALLCMGC